MYILSTAVCQTSNRLTRLLNVIIQCFWPKMKCQVSITILESLVYARCAELVSLVGLISNLIFNTIRIHYFHQLVAFYGFNFSWMMWCLAHEWSQYCSKGITSCSVCPTFIGSPYISFFLVYKCLQLFPWFSFIFFW